MAMSKEEHVKSIETSVVNAVQENLSTLIYAHFAKAMGNLSWIDCFKDETPESIAKKYDQLKAKYPVLPYLIQTLYLEAVQRGDIVAELSQWDDEADDSKWEKLFSRADDTLDGGFMLHTDDPKGVYSFYSKIEERNPVELPRRHRPSANDMRTEKQQAAAAGVKGRRKCSGKISRKMIPGDNPSRYICDTCGRKSGFPESDGNHHFPLEPERYKPQAQDGEG